MSPSLERFWTRSFSTPIRPLHSYHIFNQLSESSLFRLHCGVVTRSSSPPGVVGIRVYLHGFFDQVSARDVRLCVLVLAFRNLPTGVKHRYNRMSGVEGSHQQVPLFIGKRCEEVCSGQTMSDISLLSASQRTHRDQLTLRTW
jgi:hypothetical protein